MVALLTLLGLTTCAAAAVVGARMVRAPVSWDRFELDDAAEAERSARPSLVARAAAALEPTALSFTSDASLRRYRRRLEAAGRPEGLTAEEFLARRAVWVVALGGAGLFLSLSGNVFTGLVVAGVGVFLQDAWLRGAVRRRQSVLERDLPDFLDVLSVTVEAGLGFQAAFARVAAFFEGPLGEEAGTTLRQMDFGASRREAFEGLRNRNQSEVLDAFVVALRQAEELGAPLTDTLRNMADDLREQWNQKARRNAAQTVPRISLIVAFTIVPASLLLILAAMVISSGLSTDLFS
jgi:tight adherence protein C